MRKQGRVEIRDNPRLPSLIEASQWGGNQPIALPYGGRRQKRGARKAGGAPVRTGLQPGFAKGADLKQWVMQARKLPAVVPNGVGLSNKSADGIQFAGDANIVLRRQHQTTHQRMASATDNRLLQFAPLVCPRRIV